MNVLIVKLGAIGDVVMAMPLLTHLHNKYPDVRITWVCGRQVRPLLESTGLIHRLIDVDEKALLTGSFFSKIRVLASVWKALFLCSFDLCLIGYVDPRYKLLTLTARCRERRSFYRDKRGLFPTPGRYHAYEYLRLAEKTFLNGEATFPRLALPSYSVPDKPFLILAPGGAKNLLADDSLRRWPAEHYAALMRLFGTMPMELVVIGASTDAWVCDYFSEMAYTNLVGKLSLLELVALLKEAKLLITHDSGPLHLGKLVDCPTIALFGPTNPWEKVSRHENIEVLWGGQALSCRPCYDGKTYARCTQNQCLEGISPKNVFDVALEVLQCR